MSVWPTHSRSQSTAVRIARRGPRKVQPEPNWDVPVLDSGTRVSSRLLVDKVAGSSRISWTNINEAGKLRNLFLFSFTEQDTVDHISTGNTRCIFPPTRELPPALHNGLSFEQKVLHTVGYLSPHSTFLTIFFNRTRGYEHTQKSWI